MPAGSYTLPKFSAAVSADKYFPTTLEVRCFKKMHLFRAKKKEGRFNAPVARQDLTMVAPG